MVFQLLKSSLKEKMCLHAAGAVALDHRTEQVVFPCVCVLVATYSKMPLLFAQGHFWGSGEILAGPHNLTVFITPKLEMDLGQNG